MRAVSPTVDLPALERDLLSEWDRSNLFQKTRDARKGARAYSFYDGPPFANGLPHYGHLLANTIKDVVPRYWTMRGFFVDRRFGWDCHGLPVEFEIEKREGLKGRQDILSMGVERFNALCSASIAHYTGEWRRTITRLGRWVDWDRQYRTMDPSFVESVWWVFAELHRRGLVYKDYKVVPYSPRTTSVVSNFEANQNYQEVQDPSVYVRFRLVDEEASVLAWTTTPWTLISNLALAVSPKILYAKIRIKATGELLYLAQSRVASTMKLAGLVEGVDYEQLETLSSDHLAGKRYHPLFPYFSNTPKAFRILLDDYVSDADGTGVVHQAPAYGEDDFRVCGRAGISLIDPLDAEGTFGASVPEYQGMYLKDADRPIIKDLKARGAVFHHGTVVHSYPFCERTNTPLIYRAIPAWYVAVEKIRDRLVQNNRQIRWIPDHLREGRMGRWLEGARDWAISRNRFWGAPIPIWICDRTDSHVTAIASIQDLQELSGTQVRDIHKPFIDSLKWPCDKCPGTMQRIEEVFDCWFESGSMPYAQLHYPFENKEVFESSFPADFIAEGLDQTRGWFYTLLVLSTALFDRPAFKNVVVNGIILDEKGRKMSKRHRNYTPPDDLLEQFGADSVRMYMLNSPILRGEDLVFSDKGVRDTIRAVILPLWNAQSFLTTYAEADHWRPVDDLESQVETTRPSSRHELDRWILSRLQRLIDAVHERMESYELYAVIPEIIEFVDELTNWYIRRSRRRFWGNEPDSPTETQAAYQTLWYVLVTFCKVFAPFAPFVSDRMYRNLTEGLTSSKESVHLCDAPRGRPELRDRDLEAKMGQVRRVVELGRGLRAKHQLKTRQVLRSYHVLSSNAQLRAQVEAGADMIREELNVKQVACTSEEDAFVEYTLKPNLKALGPRLGKDLGRVRSALAGVSQDPAAARKLVRDLQVLGSVSVEGLVLHPDDLLIDRVPKSGLVAVSEGELTVVLDTTLTDDLLLEGVAREIVNRLQGLRKDHKLAVSDRIRVELGGSDLVKRAALSHHDYVCGEVLAIALEIKDTPATTKAKMQGDFDLDGDNLWISATVDNDVHS